MKRILLLIIMVFMLTGCDKNINFSDNPKNINTTIYPLTYIMEYLYQEEDTKITSIYPNGVDLDTYKLTDKQIKEYSNSDMFVYLGASKEKELAKSFLNNNKNLQIIDASYGLSADYEEVLWIAPNNYLMLAKNIKESLNEYITNKYTINMINDNYEKLYNEISWMDAELRNVSKIAKENDVTLVVKSNVFDYLKGYGFNIIVLDNSVKNTSDIKSKFKSGHYSNILKLDIEEESEFIKELEASFDAKIIDYNTMISNSDTASDYKTIQYENINKIREIVEN